MVAVTREHGRQLDTNTSAFITSDEACLRDPEILLCVFFFSDWTLYYLTLK